MNAMNTGGNIWSLCTAGSIGTARDTLPEKTRPVMKQCKQRAARSIYIRVSESETTHEVWRPQPSDLFFNSVIKFNVLISSYWHIILMFLNVL